MRGRCAFYITTEQQNRLKTATELPVPTYTGLVSYGGGGRGLFDPLRCRSLPVVESVSDATPSNAFVRFTFIAFPGSVTSARGRSFQKHKARRMSCQNIRSQIIKS